jgi:hypothetical protein
LIHNRVTAHIKAAAPPNPAGLQAAQGSYPGPAMARSVQTPASMNPNISEQAMDDAALAATTLPNY